MDKVIIAADTNRVSNPFLPGLEPPHCGKEEESEFHDRGRGLFVGEMSKTLGMVAAKNEFGATNSRISFALDSAIQEPEHAKIIMSNDKRQKAPHLYLADCGTASQSRSWTDFHMMAASLGLFAVDRLYELPPTRHHE